MYNLALSGPGCRKNNSAELQWHITGGRFHQERACQKKQQSPLSMNDRPSGQLAPDNICLIAVAKL